MIDYAFSLGEEENLRSFRVLLMLLAKDIWKMVDVVLVSRERTV